MRQFTWLLQFFSPNPLQFTSIRVIPYHAKISLIDHESSFMDLLIEHFFFFIREPGEPRRVLYLPLPLPKIFPLKPLHPKVCNASLLDYISDSQTCRGIMTSSLNFNINQSSSEIIFKNQEKYTNTRNA